MKKAIVIGSGIAGLASAIRLKCGNFQDVLVIEKNDYPGGKLTELRLGEFRFDAGPSLFTMPQYIEELFTLAGKNIEDYFHYQKYETACHYFWNDGTSFIAPSNPTEFSQAAHKTFKEPIAHVENKFLKASFIEDKIGSLFLEQSLHKPKNFLNLKTLKGVANIPKLDLFSTLHETNKKDLDHPKLVQIFDRFATYNGSSPYSTPGIMGVIPHYEHNVGTFFPKGGMHSITESLFQLCKDISVDFQFNTEVKEIIVENGIAKGVKTAKTLLADSVICNMDIYYAYHKLMPHETAPEKTLNQERSSSALIFYWGMNRNFSELDLHNIFFADDYQSEFDHIFKGKEPYEDPTIYVHISSKLEKEDAPEGRENWFVMINTPCKKDINWEDYIASAKRYILEKLSRILDTSIPDWIVEEDLLSPKLIEIKTLSYQGSLYGTSSNDRNSAFLRHPNFSKKIKNLKFVGGSVHPGGGIPLCLLSAKIATSLND